MTFPELFCVMKIKTMVPEELEALKQYTFREVGRALDDKPRGFEPARNEEMNQQIMDRHRDNNWVALPQKQFAK